MLLHCWSERQGRFGRDEPLAACPQTMGLQEALHRLPPPSSSFPLPWAALQPPSVIRGALTRPRLCSKRDRGGKVTPTGQKIKADKTACCRSKTQRRSNQLPWKLQWEDAVVLLLASPSSFFQHILIKYFQAQNKANPNEKFSLPAEWLI